MYKITTMSNRLYEDENALDVDTITQLENNIVEFNMILYAVYNLCFLSVTNKKLYEDTLCGVSLFLYVKNKYGLNTYYANSIIQLAQGKVKAQQELQKLYITNVKEQINSKENTIKKEQKLVDNLIKFEKRIVEYRNKLKKGKKAKLTSVKGISFVKVTDNVIYIKEKKDWKQVTLNELEYDYILPQIRKHKNLLGKYKHKLDNLNAKLLRLQTLRRIIFGTKVFMKEYSTNKYSKLEFLKHKYKSYELSGRCDFPNGNRMIKPTYDKETQSIKFTLTLLNDKILTLEGIKFPYRQDKLVEVMNKSKGTPDGIAICFRISHKQSFGRFYYQISAMFDIEPTINYINYDKSTGIIAIDFNSEHLDMTELDGKGNLIHYKTFPYEISNKSYINEITLFKIIDEIAQYANSKHKILAIEDLDFNKLKSKLNTDNQHQKGLNRCIHSLPHEKYTAYAKYMKIKYHIDVIPVNPAFTSIIGELKYADKMKLNSHIAASYVIGRRALGFKDFPLSSQYNLLNVQNPDKIYKSNWAMWSALNKLNKVETA